ncbi:MAG: dienelactone hydrolase family protein [Parachlamydia sp.]|nr:dienelactone hydrolase family protein [Parachlamydia sp.]
MRSHIPYKDQDVELEGYLALPSRTRAPLVILCHAWRGRDAFICEKVDQIAELGYAGFALDMYGKDVLGKTKEENAALKKTFMDDRASLQRRLLKGYETACSLPHVDTTRIAAIGFGFGGICALDLARSGVPLAGAVSIYGHFDPPQNCPVHPIQAKILILHGFADPISPMDTLLALQEEMERDKVDWQTCLFGNTQHAFATPSAQDPDAGILYKASSAKRAWRTIETFLEEVLS